MLLKAVVLKSALLEMRCSTVALPAAGTLLRNSRNLLCMQFGFTEFGPLPPSSALTSGLCQYGRTAVRVSASSPQMFLLQWGYDALEWETAPLHHCCLDLSPVRETPPFFLPPQLPPGFADQQDMALGVYHPADFSPPYGDPRLNLRAAGRAGCRDAGAGMLQLGAAPLCC